MEKCGEIYISESIKFSFTCYICSEIFDDFECYENHLNRDNHIDEIFKNVYQETIEIEFIKQVEDNDDLDFEVLSDTFNEFDDENTDVKLLGKIKCGESFMSDSMKLTFTCVVCSENFTKFESFANHLIYDNYHLQQIFGNHFNPNFQVIGDNSSLTKKKSNESDKIFSQKANLTTEKDVEFEPEDASICENQLMSAGTNDGITQFFLNNLECHVCFTKFDTEDKYRTHVERIRCGICPICHNSFARIYRHIENLHKKIHPKYAKEGQLYYDLKLRKLTIKTETNSKAADDNFENIDMEKSATENSTIFVCSVCENCFDSKTLYEKHIEIHFEKPYKCGYCVLAFKDKIKLSKHIILKHGEEYNIKCSFEGCDVYFLNNISKIRHERKEHRISIFNCSKCKISFKSRSGLNKHKKRHLDINMKQNLLKKFQNQKNVEYNRFTPCEYCKNQIYGRHLESHLKFCKAYKQLKNTEDESVKSFECSICPEKFVNEQLLQDHSQLKHSSIENISVE